MGHSIAQANLLVTPTRVELDNKRNKSAVFSLVNKSTTPSRYEIYLEDKALLPNGEYELLESSPNSITSFTRYSPRRLSLKPEQGTRVRVAVRPPKNLAQGEYRSYIVFHQIPLAPKIDANHTQQQAESLQLSVTAYLRIAIPVIMRIGELEAELSLSSQQASMTDGQQQLIVTIERKGKRSSLGDIEILNADNNELVGSLKNAAIYPENNSRTFNITLNKPVSSGTKLTIRYTENDNLYLPKTINKTINL